MAIDAMIFNTPNAIISAHEQMQLEHCFNISSELRQKLNSFYLKVWNGKYAASRIYIAAMITRLPTIYDDGINYIFHSSMHYEEIAKAKDVALSFRALDENHAYVIIKPWFKKAQKERK